MSSPFWEQYGKPHSAFEGLRRPSRSSLQLPAPPVTSIPYNVQTPSPRQLPPPQPIINETQPPEKVAIREEQQALEVHSRSRHDTTHGQSLPAIPAPLDLRLSRGGDTHFQAVVRSTPSSQNHNHPDKSPAEVKCDSTNYVGLH